MSGNNVDRNEIAKFEALASRWWDPNSEFKPLHDINPLRLNYIDERAPLPGRKVLDVGCGGGLLSEGMAQRGAHVTGIDMGEAPLSVARLHGLESGIEVDYKQIPIETLAEDPAHIGQYDAITCLEMLEHVPEPGSIIQACAKLLRPGGDLFVSTINRNPKSFLFAIVGAEYVLNMLPKGTHEWRKFIRPSEMSDFLRHAGFEVKDLTGMTFNPITRVYKLGRDVDVNYLMHARLDDGGSGPA
ncbi:bifunctional 2-polyprenyl-6-hydroxyphenol methylase/3-demethylubiquinol 3-O-methyltransferase UbiG [Marinobacter halodurans]|uniref:Ubiquinone biosynthesis O-methyltransferase n=1 Tax=Marinobacter halodurans TaxID=2528979 RepID=A0ABY1ZND2_9GAMM|nr:bifunctional 2-polyprenyl-6-hydroxyphenol methylase/3-demethylubiquinol 3-O-methyltransferase UbiG [Marinobacter halodurans]TBW56634.1 bifunctional 2-polyprenyl-6-hydroxyphenol methylase/3-demethylubiquinol 3-O-methyltransferase UbiG [Marinobacter halodurans]